MKDEITVLIADDHPIFRRGLRQIIEEDDGLKVISGSSLRGATTIKMGGVPLSLRVPEYYQALARGAALLGDAARARVWFAEAVAATEDPVLPGWLARALTFQGEFLLAQGDGDEAAAVLERASALAERHRLVYVARRLAEVSTAAPADR